MHNLCTSLKLLEVKKIDGLRLIYPVGCTDILSAIPTNKDDNPDILSVTPDNLSTIENKERVKKENTSAQTLSTKSMPSMYYNFQEHILTDFFGYDSFRHASLSLALYTGQIRGRA